MKILITGGSGLLGQYLNIELSKKHQILTLYNKNPGNTLSYPNKQIDLSDMHSIKLVMSEFQPDAVIHTAGYANPQICRTLSKEEVYKNNVELTGLIAKLCTHHNSKMIFTSTDLVYKDSPELKTEDSPLEPLSLYTQSKLMAEEKIKENSDNYVILRTSLLYGIALNNSVNHFTEMLNKIKAKEQVKLFSDQFRSPLSLTNAAELINFITESEIKNEIMNFGGPEKLSRYDLGLKTAAAFGFSNKLITPVKFCEVSKDIETPLNVSMNISKLTLYGLSPDRVEVSLSMMAK